MLIDVERVGDDLLVVHDGEKRWLRSGVGLETSCARAENELKAERGEALDLLLPLRLQRSGRDDKHTLRFAQMMQQGTRSHGLDRLAETHLIGQKRPLAKGEMQHALALIRIKRMQRDMLRMTALDDARLVVTAQAAALLGTMACLKKGFHILRDANFGRSEDLWQHLIRVGDEEACVIKQRTQGSRQALEVAFDAQALAIRHEMEMRRGARLRELVVCLVPTFQPDERGLNVLAGAESGGAEVRAGARERSCRDIAHLDLIRHAAGRLDCEGGEDRMLWLEIADGMLLLTRPLDAAEDFDFIRAAPVSC